MGIVQQQATNNAFFSYAGALLGLCTLFISSHIFSTEENGLLKIIVAASTLIGYAGNLGSGAVMLKFFPSFNNVSKTSYLYIRLLAISTFGFLAFSALFFLFPSYFIKSNVGGQLLDDYQLYIYPVSFFTVLFVLFDAYLRLHLHTVQGSFSKDFLQRILILICMALYFFKILNLSSFVFFYCLSLIIPTFYLLTSISKYKLPKPSFKKYVVSKKEMQEMNWWQIFALFMGISTTVIITIDGLLINKLLGLSETGIYAIAFYFGTIVIIPARALYRVTAPIISSQISNNNWPALSKFYNQSVNTQFYIGLLLFILIAINLDFILQLLPPEYATGKQVIVFIALANLIEMATGINGQIIVYSKYYKYDTLFVFIFFLTVILGNLYLIPIYGITGSGIASVLGYGIVNGLRTLFLYIKMDIQPYNLKSFKILLVGVVAYTGSLCFIYLDYIFLATFLKSIVVFIIFIISLYKMNLVPELSEKISSLLNKVITKTGLKQS